jgi:hypothetical protein
MRLAVNVPAIVYLYTEVILAWLSIKLFGPRTIVQCVNVHSEDQQFAGESMKIIDLEMRDESAR